ADLAQVVAVPYLEVALQEVYDRQVAGGLAVGDRGALEGEPALQTMRVGELVGEPRLAHPGLAHDGDHLPVARTGLTEHPAQVLHLGVAAHEAREPSESGGLQARPGLPSPYQLEDLDRVRETLHGDGPERPHLDVAFGEPGGLARQPHSPGRRSLFSPG